MPKSVKHTYGDGAYDTERCYAANVKHGSIPIIPPNRNAVFRENVSPSWEIRNISLLEISGLGGDDCEKVMEEIERIPSSIACLKQQCSDLNDSLEMI